MRSSSVLAGAGAVALTAVAGCGHREVPMVDPALSPQLELQADAEAHGSMPDGQRLPGVLAGVAQAPGQSTEWSIPLNAGRCYTLGYSTDPSIARFGLSIWSPFGKRVDDPHVKAHGHPLVGVQNLCAAEEGPYRVEGKVTAGAGHFVVVTYATAVAAPH